MKNISVWSVKVAVCLTRFSYNRESRIETLPKLRVWERGSKACGKFKGAVTREG